MVRFSVAFVRNHSSEVAHVVVTFMAFFPLSSVYLGGAVASWLMRSTPEPAVGLRALTGDIVLCSWARHFTPTVPLITQVYKWAPANLMLGGNLAMD